MSDVVSQADARKLLKKRKYRDYEGEFFELCLDLFGNYGPMRQARFHPKRKWRFDFCWPAQKVAVEIEGGIWVKSRHTTGKGMHADMDKYNAAVALGWKVIRFGPSHFKDTAAMMELVYDVLKQEQCNGE